MEGTITIKQNTNGTFDVEYENKIADHLGYEEMLGLVSAITMPEKRPCLNWLWTKERRKEWDKKMKKLTKV